MTAQVLGVAVSTLRAVRRATGWWSLALAVLVAATVAFWPAFKGASGISEAIDNLPPSVIDALGMRDFGTPAGFLRGNLYELFIPLLLSIATVALISGQTAAAEAAGRLELPLAQPVTREVIFGARATACLTALAAIVLVTIVTQLVADNLVGLSVEPSRIVTTAVLCGLLAAVHGSVGYAVACALPRPSAVLGAGVGLTIAGYVIAALFPISSVLDPWRVISPWSWALGNDPLINGAEPWRFVLLAAAALGTLVTGTLVVARRDVPAA